HARAPARDGVADLSASDTGPEGACPAQLQTIARSTREAAPAAAARMPRETSLGGRCATVDAAHTRPPLECTLAPHPTQAAGGLGALRVGKKGCEAARGQPQASASIFKRFRTPGNGR